MTALREDAEEKKTAQQQLKCTEKKLKEKKICAHSREKMLTSFSNNNIY